MANIINNQDPSRHNLSVTGTGSIRKFPERPERRYDTFYDASKSLPTETVEAWKTLIHITSSRPAIALPDFGLPFQLHIDVSVGQEHHDPTVREGIGAILTQIQDGVTRPIGYFSRQFGESERKHNAYNAELASIVASLNHFYYYLKGSRTTIITNYLPRVKNSRRDNNSANALQMEINEMDIELIRIRGDARPTDAFSRQPLPEDYPGIKEARQAKTDMQLVKTTSAEPKDTFKKGGRTPNNGGDAPIDQGQPQPLEQSRDAFGFNNYDQSDEGRLTRGHKGGLVCNYCGITNHPSSACRTRLRDLEKGIIRQQHPDKGSFGLHPTRGRDSLSKIVNAIKQREDTRSAPMTLTITDPEDARWLMQASNSGIDPAQVISVCRLRQQNHSRSKAANDPIPQTPKIPSSRLPSGLMICNECTHVSATFELADRHQKETHPGKQNYSQSQAADDLVPEIPRVSASLLPSGLVACNECAHISPTFELSDKHQKDAHPEPAWTLPPFWNTGNRQINDMVSAPTIEKSPITLPSKLVACNKCSHLSATFETADIHQIEAHPGLANEPDRRN